MKRILALTVCAVTALSAFAGTEFTWTGGQSERPFGNSNYWAVGRAESGGTNPDGLVPGSNDEIFYGTGSVYKKFYFNLDGTNYTVKGFSGFTFTYNYHDMSVRNGTLTFAGSFSNRYCKVIVYDTGRLALGPDSVSMLGESAARNSFDVRSGGALTFGGTVLINNLTVTVAAGGLFTCQPASFAFNWDSSTQTAPQQGQGFVNAGTMDFPNGLTLGGTGSTAYPALFTVRQNAGTLKLGGSVTRDGATGKLAFYLGGGTLDVTADAAFTGLETVEMDADAAAAVSVSAGKTCDLSAMTFGSGTSLEKTGAGTLVFGADAPDSLSVSNGAVRLTSAGSLFPSGLALADGVSVSLGAVNVTIDAVTGYANASFSVDASLLEAGVGLLFSSDAAFLEAVRGKLSLPAGFTAEVADGALVVRRDMSDRNTFTSNGEANLSDASRWNVSPVPENADVFVSGESTIAVLDASTPSFHSINVLNGATLKVSGSPAALPPIILTYDAKILFAAGASLTLAADAVTGVASERQIPVFEVATGAVVTVTNNYAFKNVDLRLYGQITASGDAYFGTAAADETAHFAMSVIGGKISATGMNTLCFVSPVSGGTVRVHGKMCFKGITWLPAYQQYWKVKVGYGNPVSEPFTMEFDGCYLDLRGSGDSYIGGAATVSCVNGGGLIKPPAWASPGLYSQVYVQDRARLLLDGASYVIFSHSRYWFRFEPAEDGFEQLVLKNGSYLAIHEPNGTKKAVATFEDSYWDVIQLCKLDSNFPQITDGRQWMTNTFRGLKAVNVPAGKFVGIRSSESWVYGTEWNREILLDPDVPITGGGSLIVTNASPGYGMRAIVACTNNTATGEAKACAGADETKLVFADGANWAGTVAGSANIAFTNRTDGAAPAKVRFGALRFEGDMPVRVWKRGANTTNDFIALSLPFAPGTGGFAPVLMEGGPVEPGDTFTIGTYPASALPLASGRAFAARNWLLVPKATDDPAVALLTIRYSPLGMKVILR